LKIALLISFNSSLFDLREEIKNVLKQNKDSCVLILGTPISAKRDLYNFKGIKSHKPNNKELKEISKAIFKFNTGEEKQKKTHKVRKISNKYIKKGSETIILGCTELSLMLKKEKINKINTIDVLVDATIRRFLSEKNSVKKFTKTNSTYNQQ
jgi:aspartate racemase